MTTIAWDGETLAADRLITAGGFRNTESTKIHKRSDGALLGVCGELCTSSAFVRWFMAGEEGEQPSLKAKNSPDQEAGAIVIRPNGVVEAYDQDGWHVVETKQYAIGSGSSLARMAMRCGKSAARAVELVAEFDVYTGSSVDVLHYDP